MVSYTGFARDGKVTRVNEREMAQMFYAAGDHGTVFDVASHRVTAVGGARRVTIAVGALSACGVIARREGVTDLVVVDLPVPGSGQGRWHLQVASFDWNTRAVRYELLGSDTTAALAADKMPQRAPDKMPTTLRREPGVIFDVPLAWVWSSYSHTTLQVFDLRRLPGGRPVQFATTTKRTRRRRDDSSASDSNALGLALSGVLGWTFPDLPPGDYDVSPSWVVAADPATTGLVEVVVNGDIVGGTFQCNPTNQVLQHSITWPVTHPGGNLTFDLRLSAATGGAIYRDGTRVVITPHPW